MKILLLTTFTIFHLVSFGQNIDEKIKEVKTADQANNFIKENPTLNAELLEFNSNVDSSEIAKKIFDSKLQSIITIDGYIYKIIETKSSYSLRASYIYLSGDKLSIQQIDSLRKVIINKYDNGIPFTDLAKEYTMDGNPDCDLGWFSEEMMVKEFSTAVKEHKKGDIFTIDVPIKKWYYVTIKPFDDRQVKTYKTLKIKSST